MSAADGAGPRGPVPPSVSAALSEAYGSLLGYLQSVTGERALAEDIAQEAGMRLVDLAQRGAQEIRNPRALLFHIASNLARDQLRRRQVRGTAVPVDECAESAEPSVEQRFDLRQEIARVSSAIERLPKRRREVLLLSRVEGYSHKEVGARLGISAKTVENQLARALSQLAKDLET